MGSSMNVQLESTWFSRLGEAKRILPPTLLSKEIKHYTQMILAYTILYTFCSW